MSRYPIVILIFAAAAGGLALAAPSDDGCTDRGYGEPSYCPPRPTTSPSARSADTGDCVDGGIGESSQSHCPTPQAPSAPAPSPAGRCIDRGWGDSTYCSTP